MRKVLGALALAAAVMLPTAASAQDYPPTTGGPLADLTLVRCNIVPGGTGSVTVSGLPGDLAVGGIVNSDPIVLATVTSSSGGSATFSFEVPTDFEVNARHTVTVTDAATGAIIGAEDFFVASSGGVVTGGVVTCGTVSGGGTDGGRAAGGGTGAGSGSGSGSLPRTGISDSLATWIQVGLAAVAVGGVLVIAARRRRSAPPAAA